MRSSTAILAVSAALAIFGPSSGGEAWAQADDVGDSVEPVTEPSFGMVGEWGYGSPAGSDIAGETEGDVIGLGLTPLLYWGPPNTVEFKTAAVCHFGSVDRYVVFAAFVVAGASDELWAVWIDGLSTSPDYGEILTSPGPALVASQGEITHVDCTTDGGSNAFVTWDFLPHPGWNDARWRRVTASGGLGASQWVPDCHSAPTYGTGIAYHGGRVAISGAGDFCYYCWWVFSATYPYGLVGGDDDGPLIDPQVTDVEWNGGSHFLMVALTPADEDPPGYPPHIFTRRFETDGDPYPAGSAPTDIFLGEIPCDYRDIDLVLSENDANPYDRLIAQVDRRVVWLSQEGQQLGAAQVVGPWATFATCEYWGPRARIAHTFSPDSLRTRHNHWRSSSHAADESYLIDDAYRYPTACSSSDGETDAEVLLVREYWGSPPASAYMFFSMEAED